MYEYDLATRVYAEAYRMLKVFIPIYMVAARDPRVYIPQSTPKYFMMAKNGAWSPRRPRTLNLSPLKYRSILIIRATSSDYAAALHQAVLLPFTSAICLRLHDKPTVVPLTLPSFTPLWFSTDWRMS